MSGAGETGAGGPLGRLRYFDPSGAATTERSVVSGASTTASSDRYLPFVRSIAESVKRQLSPPMEVDELISCGFIGLQEATRRYDASWGVRFETFAYYRVRGAILDGIASQCMLSRHMARKLSLARKANDYMEGISTEAAWMSEKSKEANAALLAAVVRDLTTLHEVVSVTFHRGKDEEEIESEFVDETAARGIERALERSELRAFMQRLDPDQSRLLELYYFEDMTLESAASRLGFTKSWACKLHSAAIRKLRHLMAVK